ncbi:MerR family transcriptional regulator [Ahniella affigens]|uniref:MerR family transcriptional regulator n=1 Tax=Ahniella affigens TaxID=2021234 RepID=A0A2P1PQT1_9GAMM|nr:MerR family transcriptional regulator [Ahniella affigens]AVP97168.1 MerR family transcriptional regulator [Ahniella affigens]
MTPRLRVNTLPATCITLGTLCRELGLARASVLHYESIGLLHPTRRSAAGYRLYGPEARAQAQMIRELRSAGLSLTEIGQLLQRQRSSTNQTATSATAILEQRLLESSVALSTLRAQQRLLARLLATQALNDRTSPHSKTSWVALLRQAGFDDQSMRDWHCQFEREAPTAHRAFLRSLGMTENEVRDIQKWSIEAAV